MTTSERRSGSFRSSNPGRAYESERNGESGYVASHIGDVGYSSRVTSDVGTYSGRQL